MSDHDTFSSGCNNLTEAELESIGVDPKQRAVDMPLAWAAAEQRIKQLDADLLACTRARDEAQQRIAALEAALNHEAICHDQVKAERDAAERHAIDGLADLRHRTEAAEQALKGWRTWAQFVWLGGGSVSGDDDLLKRRLCEAADQDRAHLAALHAAVTQLVAQWRLHGDPRAWKCADALAALLVFPSDQS